MATAAASAVCSVACTSDDDESKKRKRAGEIPARMLKDAVNLMPHELKVLASDKETAIFTLPASGAVARLLDANPDMTTVLDGIPVRVGAPTFAGLSVPLPDAPIVVSALVADYVSNCMFLERRGWIAFHHAIWVPDTNPRSVVRDRAGMTIGTTALTLYQRCRRDDCEHHVAE